MSDLDYISDLCKEFPPTKYPNIRRACYLIALDNGGIHRDRTNWIGEYEAWVARQDGPLLSVDMWLGGLSVEDFDTVCTGEHGESETLLYSQSAPKFTDTLLNDFFDEVC